MGMATQLEGGEIFFYNNILEGGADAVSDAQQAFFI